MNKKYEKKFEEIMKWMEDLDAEQQEIVDYYLPRIKPFFEDDDILEILEEDITESNGVVFIPDQGLAAEQIIPYVMGMHDITLFVINRYLRIPIFYRTDGENPYRDINTVIELLSTFYYVSTVTIIDVHCKRPWDYWEFPNTPEIETDSYEPYNELLNQVIDEHINYSDVCVYADVYMSDPEYDEHLYTPARLTHPHPPYHMAVVRNDLQEAEVPECMNGSMCTWEPTCKARELDETDIYQYLTPASAFVISQLPAIANWIQYYDSMQIRGHIETALTERTREHVRTSIDWLVSKYLHVEVTDETRPYYYFKFGRSRIKDHLLYDNDDDNDEE